MINHNQAIIPLALTAVLTLGGCAANEKAAPEAGEPSSGRQQPEDGITLYVPVYDGDMGCDALPKKSPESGVSRLVLSFATPTAEGLVRPPEISEACKSTLRSYVENKFVTLAIGGYGGSEEENLRMRGYWDAARQNPAQFAASAIAAADEVSAQIGTEVRGIGLDEEFAESAADVEGTADLAAATRGLAPEYDLTVAVHPDGVVPGTDVSVKPVAEIVDQVQIMGYDHSYFGQPVAGDLAPEDWVLESAKRYKDEVGDPNKLAMLYPAYGNNYDTDRPYGDINTNQTNSYQVLLKNVPQDVLDAANEYPGANGVMYQGNWLSLVTPEQMKQTQNKLAALGIVESGVWSAAGTNTAVIEALNDK